MMTKGNHSHPIAGVFVFLLLGLFAVFSTLMVLTGAKAYRGTVDRSDAHNRARIASSYIRSMSRLMAFCFSASRLSCRAFPRHTPSSSLMRPFFR